MNYTELLQKNGYIVIENVLNDFEIEQYSIKFNDWKNKIENFEYKHKYISPHGIIKHFEIGHQEFNWEIRCNNKIRKIFETIWETSELCVSFDGTCYIPKGLKKKNSIWTHTDQSPKKKGIHCYQGFVSLTSNEKTTIVVYEKSHLLHEKYMKDYNLNHNKDWIIIEKEYLNKIQDSKKILNIKKGSVVIWDSRTFHQNQWGDETEDRLISYISYLPKKYCSDKMKEKRMKYFIEKRTTSHWAYPLRVNSLQPQTYGNEKLLINYSILPKIIYSDNLLQKIKELI
jgi:hypothetical protein